ncbi:MAG TPA: rhomboid family intramembrane serine protease [Steroidobacteraceae bacterium]|jgi:rhomboid protease GluP
MDDDLPDEADGTIDYSHYTREQVSHALNRIDQYAQPKNAANLLIRYRELQALDAAQEAIAQSRQDAEEETFAGELGQRRGENLVVPSLIGMNCLVFLLAASAGGGFFSPIPQVLLQIGTNFAPRTLHGEWWRLFTSMFIHFGVLHLATNMAVLWSFGRQIERLYGSGRFLAIYLLCGLTGGVASLLWNPNVNSAGASGAIIGILGSALAFALNPKTTVPPTVAAAEQTSLALFVGYNLINGLTHQGIDNAAHVGGLVTGFVAGWLLCRPLPSARGASLAEDRTTPPADERS